MIQGFLDTREVSRKLMISVSAVNRLAARGTLAYAWCSGRRLFHRDGIEKYLLDAEAQKRRRNVGGKISRGQAIMSVDGALSEMAVEISTRKNGGRE